ncbi:putative calcium-binding protein [Purpureocillium lavendulum]|uniref:Calcium-binding protein n=1 Tax=Purpureocillium lavendulum TaxID=1247861 RepID=A0AB34FS79_9HYPO|nr:putative calcium-binding protein [Purpureocillium lavendulum]
MAMNNKNWNDRADKDLFFTILSVKNIGVISGAEWTTIGNHMRTLGYGFTNEGCRQHFQGLRRAQNKAEANGTVPESARRVDPTLNPITRRPGPGRGRPRKQPQEGGQNVQPDVPEDHSQGPFPGGPYYPHMPDQVPGAAPEGTPDQHGQSTVMSAGGDMIQSESVSAAGIESSVPALASADVHPDHIPGAHDGGHEAEVDVDADGAESAGHLDPTEHAVHAVHAVQDVDDHPAKRQKMDVPEPEPEPEHDPSLDDEAVLALAAHNGTGPGDQYGSECASHGFFVGAVHPADLMTGSITTAKPSKPRSQDLDVVPTAM